MIRKLHPSEIDETIALWYAVSVKAHDFIAPEYREAHKAGMATTYWLDSETYVYMADTKIRGFVSMVDSFPTAIVVASDQQGKGIGKPRLIMSNNHSR